MLFLSYLRKLIQVLNECATPNQIAGAVVLGAMVGLIPGLNLLSFSILVLLFLLNVNLAMGFMAIALFKIIGYIFDPLAHAIGLGLLVYSEALFPLWTALSNIPFVPFTRFNNTVVLGHFVLGLLFAAPLFFGTKRGVGLYRQRWRAQVEQWKVVRAIKASKFYSWYETMSKFRGN